MITKLDIANQALRELRLSSIQSLESDSSVAAIVSEALDWSIRSVFTDKNWTYSTKTFTLSPTLEKSDTSGQYTKTFELPADVDHITSVVDAAFTLVEDYRVQGRLVFSDLDKLIIRYISFTAELVNVPHTLASLIALHLAKTLCLRLTEDENLLGALTERYVRELSSASSADSRQNPIQQYMTDDTSGFISAHKGYGPI